MRWRALGTAVLIVISGWGVLAARGPDATAQLPDILTTPSPEPTPRPTPKPKPKPKPPPYPALPSDPGTGRRVVYSVPRQRVWIVGEQGKIAGSWLVSGRSGVPKAGRYEVFSRSRYTRSGDGRYRMEYMVRFAHGRTLAIGFHSIPVDGNGRPAQSEEELGTYQSAGCVRQKKSDALTMWNFAPVGTKVVVTHH